MMPDPAVLQYPQSIALPPKSFIFCYSLSLTFYSGGLQKHYLLMG